MSLLADRFKVDSQAFGMRMRNRYLLIILMIGLLGLSAYYAYTRATGSEGVITSTPATALVRQGDLLISVSGSGELFAQEIPLAFSVAGEISELYVAVGDTVQAGELLGRLENSQAELDLKQAQLNWAQLTTPQIIASAEQRLLELEQELSAAQAELAYVQDGPPVWYYEVLLDQALADYEEVRQDYLRALRLSEIDPKGYRALAMQLGRSKERAELAVEASRADLAWVKNYQPDPQALAEAGAQSDLAAARLAAQAAYLEVLKGGPLPGSEAAFARNPELLALERARLGLDRANWNLQQSMLLAPAAGTITELLVSPGMRIDEGKPVLVLTGMDALVVRFYLEEADVAQISPGDRLEMQLDAYPDQTFQGNLGRIDPALVMVDGSMVVQAWGEFTETPQVSLLPGMSLDVEVTAAEAQDVLLVPIQALRQNTDGSGFVEVLQADGTFKAISVSVGLKDLANAQVLSGVQVGDQVSTAAR